MRDYIKPFIDDEEIEIEDICTVSSKESIPYDSDENDTDGTGLFFN